MRIGKGKVSAWFLWRSLGNGENAWAEDLDVARCCIMLTGAHERTMVCPSEIGGTKIAWSVSSGQETWPIGDFSGLPVSFGHSWEVTRSFLAWLARLCWIAQKLQKSVVFAWFRPSYECILA